MICVELRTPEGGASLPGASLRVEDDGSYEIRSAHPRSGVIDLTATVIARGGRRLAFAQDPGEWARSLPNHYRSGDLRAVIVHDDHPHPSEPNRARPRIELPQPAAAHHER